MKKLSFIIPCYGSENTLETVVENIIEKVSMLDSYDYEIILIDDFSPDKVSFVIKDLCKNNSKIKALFLSRNFGQHNAILAGFKASDGDIVFAIDDDGQLSFDNISLFLDKIDEGYDIVMGKFTNTTVGFIKRLGSKVNSFMAKVLIGKPKGLEITSLYAMKRFVVNEMIKYENPYPYIAGLMLRSTARITNVTIEQHKRLNGKSGYSLIKLFSLWLNGFTAFSIKPLRLATFAGVITAIVGFIYAIYIVIKKILNPAMPAGYSSTIAIILFVGGMLMLMLGLIGEYIGRIYISINKSPQYVIRETINVNEDDFERKE